MSQRYNEIPSTTALIAFEASARLKSQSKAAIELGVTGGAISRQIKIIEELLGTELLGNLLAGIH
jgi:LysR family transcriptional regulator, glycine cleavage system transcriptional activator